MTADPRAALASLVAAFERHLEAAASRSGENDPSVVAAYQDLADAFEAYDDALLDSYAEVTPLDVYSDDDDDSDDDDSDDDDSDDDDSDDDDSDDDDSDDDDSDDDDSDDGSDSNDLDDDDDGDDDGIYVGLADSEYDDDTPHP